jgi:hypothetical protein
VRPSRRAVAAAWWKPEGSLIRATPVRVASGPDEGESRWYCQTVRARSARPEGVTRVNQCLTLRNSEAGLKSGGYGAGVQCVAIRLGRLVNSEAV